MAWTKRRLLGQGAFGKVFLAQSSELLAECRRPSDVPVVALKCAKQGDSQSLLREEHVYTILGDSRYILKFLESGWGRDSNGNPEYCLALEFASGGTLKNHLGGRTLCESVASRYTKMLLKGLEHVHQNGYVHCDLKPDNVLVFPTGDAQEDVCLKLADFGRAKRRWQTGSLRLRGTLEYSSPEAVARGEHEVAADIWALGCIVYLMLHGHGMWDHLRGAGNSVLWNSIAQFQGRHLGFVSSLSANAKDFLRNCLRTNPRERWKAEQLLQHPFTRHGGFPS
ncbi:Mitogen-activated protein kinase kinase kinase yoda [Heracleum sosnowskyi]|uniref:Mitogen-activated protein kinase kinase kinase yoda n=1 Tax=Heracleum sosnowskyi TaxID=360622 RepID=A0AAD8GQZ6_9APIA|nr:Mitogen-activated protein kinase kinase kinase yoda [Heracleum sosnowskyi]